MKMTERTLSLEEAAEILGLHPETLRQKAKTGEVPAAKPGKRWVFYHPDLIAYLRSLYSDAGRAVQVPTQQETQWHCTNATARGGSASPRQMANEYVNLLGLKTRSKPKNCTTR